VPPNTTNICAFSLLRHLHYRVQMSECVTYSRKFRLGNKYFLTSTSTWHASTSRTFRSSF